MSEYQYYEFQADEAVTLLRDLSDVAAPTGKQTQFEAELNRIRQEYRNRPTLMCRLNDAKLT